MTSREEAELTALKASNAVQKLDLEQLSTSGAWYRRIVEHIREGIGLSDAEGRWTFTNRRIEEILGHGPGEMIGQDLLAELTPEGWGRAESGEARLVRRDGQTIWVKFDSSPITDEAGNHAGLITVLLDITERRSAEERLRRSEELLQEAQDLARIGSWERDFRTGVFTGSAALYRIFGTTVAELSASRGLKLDLVHPRDRERVRATIEAAIAQRQPYYLDFQLDRPGEVQFVHTRGRVICDEDGTPLRTVGIVQDVTE